MIVVDVNVLVAAHRGDHPEHDRARTFLQDALASDTVIAPDLVWAGFLRVVTNRRIFPVPTPLGDAVAFVRAVLSASTRRPPGGIELVDAFLDLALASNAAGDLVPDAYIASVAIENGCPVATFDRDFRRFDGLRIVEPPRS